VVNAANIEKDWQWCVKNAAKFGIVPGKDLINASDDIAQLAVQGPLAMKAMQKLTSAPVTNMEYYTFRIIEFAGIKEVIFSTTGYTGAGGCEIYVRNEEGPKLWKQFLKQERIQYKTNWPRARTLFASKWPLPLR
jgi:aminomethyltransferase